MSAVTVIITVFGLLLDLVGAVIVLGPDSPKIDNSLKLLGKVIEHLSNYRGVGWLIRKDYPWTLLKRLRALHGLDVSRTILFEKGEHLRPDSFEFEVVRPLLMDQSDTENPCDRIRGNRELQYDVPTRIDSLDVKLLWAGEIDGMNEYVESISKEKTETIFNDYESQLLTETGAIFLASGFLLQILAKVLSLVGV